MAGRRPSRSRDFTICRKGNAIKLFVVEMRVGLAKNLAFYVFSRANSLALIFGSLRRSAIKGALAPFARFVECLEFRSIVANTLSAQALVFGGGRSFTPDRAASGDA